MIPLQDKNGRTRWMHRAFVLPLPWLVNADDLKIASSILKDVDELAVFQRRLVIVVFVVLGLGVIDPSDLFSSSMFYISMTVRILACVVLFFLMLSSVAAICRNDRNKIVTACNLRSICPSCLYATRQDDRGLAMCPECGGEW